MPAVMSLNIASPDCGEAFFAGRVARCVNLRYAGSLTELRDVLDRHLDNVDAPATLDLIGHSTRDHRLLRLGHTPIDAQPRRRAVLPHTGRGSPAATSAHRRRAPARLRNRGHRRRPTH